MIRYIAALALLLLPLLAPAAGLTPRDTARINGQLRQEIRRNYVLDAQVAAIDRALAELQRSPALTDAITAPALAEMLTATLRRFDQHFGVQWRDPVTPITSREDWFARLARQNSGFARVELLPGNVGYIDFWGFDNVNAASTARAAAAMAGVADADALVFDLRRNGGGSGEMVRLLSSYLLAGGVHLNSIYWKPTNTTTSSGPWMPLTASGAPWCRCMY